MPKHIWLINPYGPIPGEGWRDYRFTLIGRMLAAAGFVVTWWTSSFSHHFKSQRCLTWQDRKLAERFTLRLVPSPSYNKNVGVGRVWRDLVFGWRTYRRGRQESPPDLVLFSESPLTFGLAGYRLGRKHRAKMIFDQMDLWPELIEEALTPTLRWLGKPFFAVVYAFRRSAYHRLSGSCALATPYLEAMHRVAPILRSRPYCVAYNGIDVPALRRSMSDHSAAAASLNKPPMWIWAIFAGSLGETYDVRTILTAAALLRAEGSKIQIVLAGDGPLRTEVEKHADRDQLGSGVIYLGRLSPQELAGVYVLCDIGLCAYSSRSNVEMPDKLYDYTAAGLAILNSLPGEASRIIREHQAGLQYQAGSASDMAAKLRQFEASPDQLSQFRRRSHKLGDLFDQTTQLAKIRELVIKLV